MGCGDADQQPVSAESFLLQGVHESDIIIASLVKMVRQLMHLKDRGIAGDPVGQSSCGAVPGHGVLDRQGMSGFDRHLLEHLISLDKDLPDLIRLMEIGLLKDLQDQFLGIFQFILQNTAGYRNVRRTELRFILSGTDVEAHIQSSDRELGQFLQLKGSVILGGEPSEQIAGSRDPEQIVSTVIRDLEVQRKMYNTGAGHFMEEHLHSVFLGLIRLHEIRFHVDLVKG